MNNGTVATAYAPTHNGSMILQSGDDDRLCIAQAYHEAGLQVATIPLITSMSVRKSSPALGSLIFPKRQVTLRLPAGY